MTDEDNNISNEGKTHCSKNGNGMKIWRAVKEETRKREENGKEQVERKPQIHCPSCSSQSHLPMLIFVTMQLEPKY